ncbi:hypothetical protein HYT92_03570 [Candidatus Pacearchaeota archaeon]|nr:hypothetical protein [Candidatus Pacearchaeota archaeon]
MARITFCFCLAACLLAGCIQSKEDMGREEIKAIRQKRINAERALARERSAIAREQKRISEMEQAKAYDERLGYITGTVIDESNVSGYCIGIKTDDGRAFGLYIVDAENKKAEALNMIIEKGSIIGFPAGNLKSADSSPVQYYFEETCFDEGVRIGAKRADRVRVLGANHGGE